MPIFFFSSNSYSPYAAAVFSFQHPNYYTALQFFTAFFFSIPILLVAESCLIKLAGLNTLWHFEPLATIAPFYLSSIGFPTIKEAIQYFAYCTY
jgi:hypothetical protein